MKNVKPKRILIFCPYPRNVAAGQRLKYEQYISDWESLGHQVDVANFFSKSGWKYLYAPKKFISKSGFTIAGYFRRLFQLISIRKYDIVYVHMWVTPLGPPGFEYLTRKLARRLVYDIEDFIVGSDVENRSGYRRFLKTRSKIKFLIRNADDVIASAPALSMYCAQMNKYNRSTYITSSVDCDRYQATSVKSTDSDSLIRIGWTGTLSTFEYLKQIRDVLVAFNSKYPFEFVVIGNFEYEDPDLNLELITWREESEIEDLAKIDIGLYPLPENDFVSGKSGLKAIQYQAMGIPFVASNVGNTPQVMLENQTGLLADSFEKWYSALESLYLNQELRETMGEAGRTFARERFSREVVKLEYRHVLFGDEES